MSEKLYRKEELEGVEVLREFKQVGFMGSVLPTEQPTELKMEVSLDGGETWFSTTPIHEAGAHITINGVLVRFA